MSYLPNIIWPDRAGWDLEDMPVSPYGIKVRWILAIAVKIRKARIAKLRGRKSSRYQWHRKLLLNQLRKAGLK